MKESNLKDGAKEEGLINTTNIIYFEQNQTIFVPQMGYAIVHSNSQKTILGTTGARTCLILALYDEKNKIAFLAHIDDLTDYQTPLLSILEKFSLEHTVGHLYGGAVCSMELCQEVLNFVKEKNIQIINEKIGIMSNQDLLAGTPGVSLAIDATTGQLITPVNLENFGINNSDVWEQYEKILEQSFFNEKIVRSGYMTRTMVGISEEFQAITLIDPVERNKTYEVLSNKPNSFYFYSEDRNGKYSNDEESILYTFRKDFGNR